MADFLKVDFLYPLVGISARSPLRDKECSCVTLASFFRQNMLLPGSRNLEDHVYCAFTTAPVSRCTLFVIWRGSPLALLTSVLGGAQGGYCLGK